MAWKLRDVAEASAARGGAASTDALNLPIVVHAAVRAVLAGWHVNEVERQQPLTEMGRFVWSR